MVRPMSSTRLRPMRSPTHAPGEQQAREHEDVGVDGPLQLALGGAELALHASGWRR